MSKDKSATAGSILYELLQFGVYKRSQGKITRQVTFAAMGIVFALGAWRLHSILGAYGPLYEYLAPGLVLLVGLWGSYRVVNWPQFADFLIAVEAEMNKVSWPSRAELIRSALVVMFVIFALAAVLYFYDFIWQMLFQRIGVMHGGG